MVRMSIGVFSVLGLFTFLGFGLGLSMNPPSKADAAANKTHYFNGSESGVIIFCDYHTRYMVAKDAGSLILGKC